MPSRGRGRQKPKLTDLSRHSPTTEERAAVRDALVSNESPIATAVLGATVAEYELESELRSRFRRKDDDTWKELTSDIGPLGTFNQKIIAAYAFGVLNEVTRDGMNTIRQIRNVFAHSKRLVDFDHELIVRELRRVTLPKGTRSKLYERLSGVRRLNGGPRKAYVGLCLILGLELLGKRRKREGAASRARHNRRRQALAEALRHPHELGGLGLRGLLGGYPPVDPKKTVLGRGLLSSALLDDAPPDT